MSKILLIDGSNYLFRAFHAMPALTTAAGEPTGALKGFLGMLGHVAGLAKADHAAVVFDAPGKTFRHELFPEYKAQRPPMPEELRPQIAPLQEAVRLLGWPLVIVPGIEADDVIGTLSAQAEALGWDSVIATGDKDLAQLVNERVVLLNTMNKKFYDREGVIEKYGVPPERMIDYLALMGDKVDNVPGIKGCGPKTAAKWIEAYGSLDGVVEHAGDVKGKAGENLRAGLAHLPLGRELVTIKRDAVIPGVDSVETLVFGTPDLAALNSFALRWEMGLATLLRAAPAGSRGAASAAPSMKDVQAALVGRAAQSAPEQGDLFGDAPAAVPEKPAAAASPAAPLAAAPAEAASALQDIPTDMPFAAENPDAIPYEAPSSLIELAALLPALEAPREEPVGISLLWDGHEARSACVEGIALALTPKDVYVLLADESLPAADLFSALGPWLASDAPKAFHDAKASLHALAAAGAAVGGAVDDTMLMDYVLEAHLGHELPRLAARMLGRRLPTRDAVLGKGAKRLSWREADRAAVEALLAEEAAAVRALSSVMREKLWSDEKLKRIYYEIERPLLPVLFRMERTGVLLNSTLLLEESKELEIEVKQLETDAAAAAGRAFNMSSPKQLAQILFEEQGIPVVKKTASGAPSTDEEVLSELALDYPLPKIILEYRRLTKLRSTYLEKLPKMVDADGRIRTTFGQATAVTGRLASAEPNLQNIPARTPEGRRIREAFEARPGWVIVDADYSQIELRIMAHLSQDAGLLAAFAKGEDVHRSTASEVFGVPLADVTPDQRRMAKVINFGLIYGMSAFGLAQQLGIDRKVASAYVDEYFRRFPGVRRYMDETRELAERQGYVETWFGRRLWLPDIRSGRRTIRMAAERAAINAPMQGTAADLIKMAMIAVDRWLAEEKLEARMLLQVHDELVIEAPEAEAPRVKAMLPKLMAGVASLSVPLLAEVGEGPNWGAAH